MPFDNSVTNSVTAPSRKMSRKGRKRGRKPVGRKAMTPAQRKAKQRQREREAAELAARVAQEREGKRTAYRPPIGYNDAKGKLKAAGHQFVRVHEDFGREWGGVFIDGAYMDTFAVIALADMSPAERKQRLAETRRTNKDVACDAVRAYMAALQVSDEDLRDHPGEAFRFG